MSVASSRQPPIHPLPAPLPSINTAPELLVGHAQIKAQEYETKRKNKFKSYLRTETKMDPLGTKVGSIDEYGNPIPGHGTTRYADHTGGLGQPEPGAQQLHGGGETPAVLRRSGSSSSSSSSEDDGIGGRRKKKGIKDKIKEKLPGGHKGDQNPQQHYDQGVTAGPQTHEPERKGIMGKIKEKLPGSHGH